MRRPFMTSYPLAVTMLFLSGCMSVPDPPSPPVPGRNLYGHYIGRVAAIWNPDGRTMKLMEAYAYIDPEGIRWEAPAGAEIDGASIPKQAWSIVGGPYEGLYRFASVIHDVACDEKKRPWEDVHLAFYYGMRASGVEEIRAKVMWAAVNEFGPRWPRYVHIIGESSEAVTETLTALRRGVADAGESLGPTVIGDAWRTTAPSSAVHTRVDSTGQEIPSPYVPRSKFQATQEVRPPVRTMSDEEFAQLRTFIETTNPPIDELVERSKRRSSSQSRSSDSYRKSDPLQHPLLREELRWHPDQR